jgi:hypothetical protein
MVEEVMVRNKKCAVAGVSELAVRILLALATVFHVFSTVSQPAGAQSREFHVA